MLIQRMRDGSEGLMAKIIIGLIIIVFGLFGFGSITTFLAPPAKVASVNGEAIPQQEMELAVERNRRMLLARDVRLQDIDEDELRDSVLQTLVTRELLAQAAEDFDLYYSDLLLDKEIVAQEVFHIDGVFNADQFQRVIGGAGYSPLSYRAEMRTDKLFEQMLSGITRSAFLTDDEAARYAALLAQSRDFAYLHIKVTDLLDEVEVSDEDIESYYNLNREDFVTEESVRLAYVEVNRDDLAAALEVDEAALETYFQQNIGLYSSDESRRLAHILIEVDTTEEAAKAEADAIYERILNGEDYTELARVESDDIGSRENGGDLGFNEQGTFDPEFEAVAYDLGVNQVSAPVKTEFGYHIIKVLDIEEAVTPSLADVREEVERAYRLAASEDDFVETSSRLAELLFESADLDVPAAELGLEIRETVPLTRDSDDPLMSDSRVEDAAFSADVLIDGNNSDLIELSPDRRIGLHVIEHTPADNKPLELVREDIRYILQRQKAQQLALARAEEIVNKVQSGSLAQFVADQYNMEWTLALAATRQQPNVDPFILNEAFTLPRPGEGRESLGFSTMPNGDSVVLRVSRVVNQPLDEIEAQEVAGIQRVLAGQLGASDFREFRESLREEADIER